MSEQSSGKPLPNIHVDISHMSSEEISALIDAIYTECPDAEFIPDSQTSEDFVASLNETLADIRMQSGGAQTQTQSRTQTEVAYPNRYKVLFLNDDFTPMDFVIQLLVEIFNKNIDQAHDITMEIHKSGSGIAGVYSLEIAEQKTHEALILCKHSGHPLEIVYEPV